jgi:D-lactate dehydrogenase
LVRKLLSPNPSRIGRFESAPTSDAPAELKADLIALLGKEKVFHRAIDLVRYASDASQYRLVLEALSRPA